MIQKRIKTGPGTDFVTRGRTDRRTRFSGRLYTIAPSGAIIKIMAEITILSSENLGITSLRLSEIEKDCRVPERISPRDFGKFAVNEFLIENGNPRRKAG